MNIKVKKKLLALIVAGTLVLCNSNVYAKSNEYDKGDIVTTNGRLNMRISNDISSSLIRVIPTDTDVLRILSYDDSWDLVRYKDSIGYVSNAYLIEKNSTMDDIVHYDIKDILSTTDKVNFRLGPGTNYDAIDAIKENTMLETIAYTDNGWYLVKYKEKIGYVNANYVYSLLGYLNSNFSNLNLTNINVSKIVYASSNLNVRSDMSTDALQIGKLSKYESATVLKEFDGWYFVKYENNYGYVKREYTKELKGIYVIVDLSLQKLTLYQDNNVILESSITTGKNTTPTNKGLFKIKDKEEDRYLIGEDYQAFVDYWMPFDGGIGLHDASWRKKFGGDIYQENGSHGCVNLPPKVAKKVYSIVSIGTKVLVHK